MSPPKQLNLKSTFINHIIINDETIKGLFFQIGEVKYFTTSDRRSGHRLEVKLFDDTVSTFPLLWCVMLVSFFENKHNN